METDYEKRLRENSLYKFLTSNRGCKVFSTSMNEYVFDCNSSSVYFYRPDGTYHRYDMTERCIKHNSRNLLNDVLKIVRVEKLFDDKWLPVWTEPDGFIETDFKNFCYIGGRYYTFKEIEQLINEIKTLKDVVAKIRVY